MTVLRICLAMTAIVSAREFLEPSNATNTVAAVSASVADLEKSLDGLSSTVDETVAQPSAAVAASKLPMGEKKSLWAVPAPTGKEEVPLASESEKNLESIDADLPDLVHGFNSFSGVAPALPRCPNLRGRPYQSVVHWECFEKTEHMGSLAGRRNMCGIVVGDWGQKPPHINGKV